MVLLLWGVPACNGVESWVHRALPVVQTRVVLLWVQVGWGMHIHGPNTGSCSEVECLLDVWLDGGQVDLAAQAHHQSVVPENNIKTHPLAINS